MQSSGILNKLLNFFEPYFPHIYKINGLWRLNDVLFIEFLGEHMVLSRHSLSDSHYVSFIICIALNKSWWQRRQHKWEYGSTCSAGLYFTRVGPTLPETVLVISQFKKSELKCFLLPAQVMHFHLDPFLVISHITSPCPHHSVKVKVNLT